MSSLSVLVSAVMSGYGVAPGTVVARFSGSVPSTAMCWVAGEVVSGVVRETHSRVNRLSLPGPLVVNRAGSIRRIRMALMWMTGCPVGSVAVMVVVSWVVWRVTWRVVAWVAWRVMPFQEKGSQMSSWGKWGLYCWAWRAASRSAGWSAKWVASGWVVSGRVTSAWMASGVRQMLVRPWKRGP